MKNQKLQKPQQSHVSKWPTRLWAVLLISALMTVLAPVSTVKSPSLDGVAAVAEEPDFPAFAAQTAKKDYGWNDYQFNCLDQLWTKESHWNPLADNPTSSAFGIAQMLGEDSRDGYTQIRNGLRYIEHRYETPCNAWKFWKRNYYY